MKLRGSFALIAGILGLPILAAPGPVDIGDRLQLLWDDALADVGKTTAERLMHRPEFAGTVYTFDHPWEGDCCFYEVLLREPDRLRIYYKACMSKKLCETHSPGVFIPHGGSKTAVIESFDGGLSWSAPVFDKVEQCGSKHNNVIIEEDRDNFYVFRDTNPACPPERRYKATAGVWRRLNKNGTPDLSVGQPAELWCYVSSNGLDFVKWRLMTSGKGFDSINTVFWDETRGEYHAYVRGYHVDRKKKDRNRDYSIRDVRHMVSKDFLTWTEKKCVDFGPDAEDYPLYTNGIHPYYRDPSVYIGFPSRYVERKSWTDNFDKLCAPDKRKMRMTVGTRREGLTTWDCVFCFSRDTWRFDRFDEAIFRPGPEHPDKNWAYGDKMVTVGEVETPGRFGVDPEISMFILEGAKLGVPNKLNRYTIRLDGYVSRHAPYAERRFVTKPLVYRGQEMMLNFSTSARGFVYVTIRGEDGEELHSTELFGDKVDRVVGFTDGSPADFAGKPVTIEFRMSDADIYSFKFASAPKDRQPEGAGSSHPATNVIWTRPICVEEGRYIGWPSVCRLKSGEILAVFSGDRDTHVCPYGKVQVVRSTDEGESWSAPVTIVDCPIDDRDAGIVQMPDGEIVVTYFTSIAYRTRKKVFESHSDYRAYDAKLSDETRESSLGYWRISSKDGGKTWSAPSRMANVSHAPHGPILLKDGSLLMLGRSYEGGVNADGLGTQAGLRTIVSAWRSTDAARTWTCLCPEIPAANGDHLKCSMFHEPHVAELPDGTLVGLVRYHGGDHGLRETMSKDGGKTWSPLRKSGLIGFPAFLSVLSDGRLLAVYSRRLASAGLGEFAALSSDGGETWDMKNEICLRKGEEPTRDFGYPSSCELPDKTILTVYYQPKSKGEKPCLMATKWRIPEDRSGSINGKM